jgi:hypothetical protein
MTKTVATWFLEDARIDEYWMAMSANEGSCLDKLSELDGVVEQLAFCCQVFDRYIELVYPEGQQEGQSSDVMNQKNESKTSTTILQSMRPEWTWKYASMERYLTTQQLQSALNLASPVQIVVGTPIQVPSVVEDAQYLSTRALKRAASTRSIQAIGTVAHSIASDVWSTDITRGVHEALIEQRGCYKEDTSAQGNASDAVKEPISPNKSNSNSFALALMGALDEDLGNNKCSNSQYSGSNPNPSPPPSSLKSPSSGGFLGSLSTSLASVSGGEKFQQIQLDTYLCALNGIHSASAACSSLVHFLDSLLSDQDDDNDEEEEQENGGSTSEKKRSQSMSMIHLAREELFRYSKNYRDLLQIQSVRVVSEFCGRLEDAPVFKGSTCIPVLRYYLEREGYELPNAQELAAAEDDVRLHKILIQPMQDCKLLQSFEKCDVDVLRSVCLEIARCLSDLFLDIILSKTIPKRFTDWGSLLLSKQVRMVQNHLQSLTERATANDVATSYQGHASAVPVLTVQWERLSQAVTILQLEKPSDWSYYYQSSSVFSPVELASILKLRVDFSADAIGAVVTAAGEAASKT